jgi:hypothetical protein
MLISRDYAHENARLQILIHFDYQIIISRFSMPKKNKDTSNMYIRDVPLELWEKINRICKQRKIKRRQFVEQALAFFEDRGKPSREEARTQQARQEVANILENLKDVEDLTKIPPKIEALRKSVPGLGDKRLRLIEGSIKLFAF